MSKVIEIDAETLMLQASQYQIEFTELYQYVKGLDCTVDGIPLVRVRILNNEECGLKSIQAWGVLKSMSPLGRLLAKRLLESLVDLKYIPSNPVEKGTVGGGMFKWNSDQRQWESGPLCVGSKGVDLGRDFWEGTFCNWSLTQLEKFILGGILNKMYLKVGELLLPGRIKEQEEGWIKYLTDGGSV